MSAAKVRFFFPPCFCVEKRRFHSPREAAQDEDGCVERIRVCFVYLSSLPNRLLLGDPFL
jgi:hypothetical protein